MNHKAILLIISVICLTFSCKPNPEKSRQRHNAFTKVRNQYKIKRITELALMDSVDAISKIFVHQLNYMLLPLIDSTSFECGKQDLKKPKPPYIIDYQFICDENITLKINDKAFRFLRKCYQNRIQRDSVFKVNKDHFIYVSPVYSTSKYSGIWGVLVGRKQVVQSLQ